MNRRFSQADRPITLRIVDWMRTASAKLPDDACVYLFLGLLRPYKGLEDLIAAFKMIESPKLRLLVAGRVFGVESHR